MWTMLENKRWFIIIIRISFHLYASLLYRGLKDTYTI